MDLCCFMHADSKKKSIVSVVGVSILWLGESEATAAVWLLCVSLVVRASSVHPQDERGLSQHSPHCHSRRELLWVAVGNRSAEKP